MSIGHNLRPGGKVSKKFCPVFCEVFQQPDESFVCDPGTGTCSASKVILDFSKHCTYHHAQGWYGNMTSPRSAHACAKHRLIRRAHGTIVVRVPNTVYTTCVWNKGGTCDVITECARARQTWLIRNLSRRKKDGHTRVHGRHWYVI